MRKHLGYFYQTKNPKRQARPGNLSLFQDFRPMPLPHDGRTARGMSKPSRASLIALNPLSEAKHAIRRVLYPPQRTGRAGSQKGTMGF